MTKIGIDQDGGLFTVKVFRNGKLESEESRQTGPQDRFVYERIKALAEEHGLAAEQVAALRKNRQLEF